MFNSAALFWHAEGNLSPSTSLPASFQPATVTLDPSPNGNQPPTHSSLSLISAANLSLKSTADNGDLTSVTISQYLGSTVLQHGLLRDVPATAARVHGLYVRR